MPKHEISPVPEFIDPVFTKTSLKRSFSVIQNERFGLVFAKSGSIVLGTGLVFFCYTSLIWVSLLRTDRTHIDLQVLAPPEISCLGIYNICYTYIFVHVLYWPEGTIRAAAQILDTFPTFFSPNTGDFPDIWHCYCYWFTSGWDTPNTGLSLLTKHSKHTPCTHVPVCNSLPVCVRMKEYRLDP